jgi:psp operon transcriptional activator
VRELKNVVERSLHRWPRPEEPVDDIVFDPFASPHRPVRAAPTVRESTAASPTLPPAPLEAVSFLERVAQYERQLLADALASNRFHQRRTAAALGLTYDQLRHYLKKYALLARSAD